MTLPSAVTSMKKWAHTQQAWPYHLLLLQWRSDHTQQEWPYHLLLLQWRSEHTHSKNDLTICCYFNEEVSTHTMNRLTICRFFTRTMALPSAASSHEQWLYHLPLLHTNNGLTICCFFTQTMALLSAVSSHEQWPYRLLLLQSFFNLRLLLHQHGHVLVLLRLSFLPALHHLGQLLHMQTLVSISGQAQPEK